MSWNYNMDECPLDTKVRLLSGDDCLLLPQREYVGTITDNGRFKTCGECYEGDPDYFYRSAIVAWKPYEEEVIEEVLYVVVTARLNTGEIVNVKFTDLVEPMIKNVEEIKEKSFSIGTRFERELEEKYKSIVFDSAKMIIERQ